MKTTDLDELKTTPKVKNYDLKVLKAKSNSILPLAMKAMEDFMLSDKESLKDKASMGFKIVNQHIVLLDKEEKLEFIKLNKSNLVLKNNMLLQKSLADDGSDYKKMVNIEPKMDLDIYGDFGEIDFSKPIS